MTIPLLAWQRLSGAEQIVWACAFATSNASDPEESGRQADGVVYRARLLAHREFSSEGHPEEEAAYRNLVIERPNFDIWYRIPMEILHGNRPRFRTPTDQECAEAFKRYRMGLDSYM